MNTATAPNSTLRGPNRVISAAFNNMPAAIADRNPVEIQWAWSWPIPNVPMTFGIITFPIVEDMIIEMAVNSTASMTPDLWSEPGAEAEAVTSATTRNCWPNRRLHTSPPFSRGDACAAGADAVGGARFDAGTKHARR